MATIIFKQKATRDILGTIIESLGLVGLTGNSTKSQAVDADKNVLTLIDLPGVSLTASQRLQLEEIAKRQGWGEGDPPPLAEEVGLLDGLTELIVNQVSTLLSTRGLSPMDTPERAALKSELKRLASRGRIS